MICRACRNVHKGQPPNCPDCGCQHRGELYKPEPVSKVAGWSCETCGTFLDHWDDDCECDKAVVPVVTPVFEQERA